MPDLSGKVAVVTGASRGVGRGVALGLAEGGAIVYATGRSISNEAFATDKIIPVRCDHTNDREVEAAFQRIFDEQERLDILVQQCLGRLCGHGRQRTSSRGSRPFWEQPLWRWDAMFQARASARTTSPASHWPLRHMVARRQRPRSSNISFWAAQKHVGNVAYGVSKAATDKLTADMAHELRRHNVAVVSMYPGLVRTESVMEAAAFLDLSNSESPAVHWSRGRGVGCRPERHAEIGAGARGGCHGSRVRVRGH